MESTVQKKKIFFSGEGKLFCESCRLQGEDVAKCYFLHPSLRRVASLDLPIMLTASLVYLGMHSDVLPWKSKWQERWTVELFWQQECGCWVGTDLHPRVDQDLGYMNVSFGPGEGHAGAGMEPF